MKLVSWIFFLIFSLLTNKAESSSFNLVNILRVDFVTVSVTLVYCADVTVEFLC